MVKTEKIMENVWSFKLDPAYKDAITITFTVTTDGIPIEMSTKQYYTYNNVPWIPGE